MDQTYSEVKCELVKSKTKEASNKPKETDDLAMKESERQIKDWQMQVAKKERPRIFILEPS